LYGHKRRVRKIDDDQTLLRTRWNRKKQKNERDLGSELPKK
jgi:hypothetical protein